MTATNSDAKLICRNVWKIFGPGAESRAAANASPPPALQDMQDAGLIGAVRGVDLEVNDGEIFVIMGLSGS